MFELAMVNELLVFELLRCDCNFNDSNTDDSLTVVDSNSFLSS